MVEDFLLALSMLGVLSKRDSLVSDFRAWRSKGRLASCGLTGLLVQFARAVRCGVVAAPRAHYYHTFTVGKRRNLQRVPARILDKVR